MERITRRFGTGVMVRKDLDFRIEPEDYDLVQTVLGQLAAYEDTGLKPEEIMDRTWISAKDELPPDKMERFLAISQFNDCMFIAERRCWGDINWLVGGMYIPKDIRYWMPLPVPPEKEE